MSSPQKHAESLRNSIISFALTGSSKDDDHRKTSDFLFLLVLSVIAFGTPLLNILGDGPEFFIHRRAEPQQILAVLLLILFAIPTLLWALGKLSSKLSEKLGSGVRWISLWLLTSLALLSLSAAIDFLPGWGLLLGSFVFGMFIARARWFQTFLLILSPLLIIAPLGFLFRPEIRSLLFLHSSFYRDSTLEERTLPSVVFLVFDEFSLNSLLDRELEIDSRRFPHFAEFSSNATWFKNATSVSQFTPIAVPALLSGKYPKSERQLPVVASHPENLFTVLGRSHKIVAHEPFTRLCPVELCGSDSGSQSPSEKIQAMTKDLVAVYLNYIVPSDLDLSIPDIDGKWGDFWSEEPIEWEAPGFSRDARIAEARQFIEKIKADGSPTLYFAHVLLPHMPYQFMPSTRMYQLPVEKGYRKDRWTPSEVLIAQGYEQYLHQIGALDTLLGEIMMKLKQVNLYDSSIIVIAADHGVSFQPQLYRRGDQDHPSFYEDVMSVPLFIKLPNQREGKVSDRNAEIVDVIPSLLDALSIDTGSQFDGVSLLRDEGAPKIDKRMFVSKIPGKHKKRGDEKQSAGSLKPFTVPRSFPRGTVDWKYSLPGYATSPSSHSFYIGHYPEHIGKSVSSFQVGKVGETVGRLVDRRSKKSALSPKVTFDPSGPTCPCHIQGYVSGSRLTPESLLGVAVNGVIQGVKKLNPTQQAEQFSFSYLVPESGFRAGDNEIALYLVAPEGSSLALQPVHLRSE
jgi:hypothetical protein